MNRPHSIFGRLRRAAGRFVRDEGGATMTEFIITLPIFILVFAGVANLSRLNRAVVRTGGIAYSQMWDKALKVQIDRPGIHNATRNSGSAVTENMRAYRGKQEDPYVEGIAKVETNRMGRGLGEKGTLGESNARVHSTQGVVTLRHIHADVTPNIGGVVGESKYGELLFDDSGSAPAISGNPSGIFGKLGSKITGMPATRMAHATGARYGEVIGSEVQKVDIAGRPFRVYQFYTTLVSPQWQHEDQATAVARLTMNRVGAYDQLLGIAQTQRLNKASQTVKKIKGGI